MPPDQTGAVCPPSSSRSACMDIRMSEVTSRSKDFDDPRYQHILEGENPPFDTANLDSVRSRNRVLDGSSGSSSSQRKRLVRMEEIIERLWDPVIPDDVCAESDTFEPSRTNCYRPSMMQNSRGRDVDLTATWHGAIDVESLERISEDARPCLVQSRDEKGCAVEDWRRLRISQSEKHLRHLRYPQMEGIPRLDQDYASEDRDWVPARYTTIMNVGGKKINGPVQAKSVPSAKKRWSWGRCFGTLKQLKKTFGPCGDKQQPCTPLPRNADGVKLTVASTREPQRRPCLSCIMAKRESSVLSSLDMSLEDVEPETGSPFLTTSALFDDPRTPYSFCASHQTTISMEQLREVPRGGLCDEQAMQWEMSGMMASEDEMDLSEVWDASDTSSTIGSSTYHHMFWVPPVLKSDKEYELHQLAARERAMSRGRPGFERSSTGMPNSQTGNDDFDQNITDADSWSWRSSSLSEKFSMDEESCWEHHNMRRTVPNSTISSECGLENIEMRLECNSSKRAKDREASADQS
ncbi:hypothetical protein BSKO_06713 [Bryopsis sp. KO-2023]|nr:hypothetical protein BSKO_06713 [Bryopsis sp. KO-2023]